MDHGDQLYEIVMSDAYQHNGLVIYSSEYDLATNITSLTNLTGWFYVALEFNNDSRVELSLWDLHSSNNTGFNNSWFANTVDGGIWSDAFYTHDNEFNWNPLEYCFLQSPDGNDTEYFHFQVMHSLNLNDYYWAKTDGIHLGSTLVDETDEPETEPNFWYGVGRFFLRAGSWVGGFNPAFGMSLRALGVGYQLSSLALEQYFGGLWDKLTGLFSGIGSWIHRIGQVLKGVINFLIDLGSMALGIIILLLAFAAAFVPVYACMIIGSTIYKLAMGDLKGARKEMSGMVASVSKVAGRG